MYIEFDGDQPSALSLQALGEGRRIASSMGAALYAFATLPGRTIEVAARDAVARTLGRAGADKVVLLATETTPGPVQWGSHGEPLHRACDDLRPNLILIPADGPGRDLAPRLATRMGAVFLAEPQIECGPRGEMVFSRTVYGGTHKRRLAGEDLGQTVVATLTPNAYLPARGFDDAELMYRPADPAAQAPSLECVDTTDDPSPLETARVVVLAGGGIDSFESYGLLRELAEALGGELGATRTLCDKGIAPAEREVGVGAHSVSPELYVVCAASGSSATLGALSGDAEVIAINLDPQADIFRIASYGIIGDVDDVVPEMLTALRALPEREAAS